MTHTESADEMLPGDLVEVKSAREIAQTLDAAGTLDGLPFMPEMAEYCGQRVRFLRKAEKTCVEVASGDYRIREFQRNDVVLLEGLRCSGAKHDGCQRSCMLFWKMSWIRKVDDAHKPVPSGNLGVEELNSRLKTMTAPDRYFCQSTQLANATLPKSLTHRQILTKCLRDLRSGAVGKFQMTKLILVPAYRKFRDRLVGRPLLLGTLKRTPVGTLGMQPGDLVEIKSLEEMRETLDTRGRNRGLVCDIELRAFCGTKDRVRSRLDRMISEPTGEMRQVQGTVILEGNTCMCARVVGGCPRLEFCYWRELWLRPVEGRTNCDRSESVPDKQTQTALEARS